MKRSNDSASVPLVSVVIPAFNAGNYIRETILSVIAQTFNAIEIIVVDDESRDDTAAQIKSIEDSRIRYYHKSNTGVSSTRNFGISKARGAFVAFLDADDLYLPNNLERKLEYLTQHPQVGLVHSAEIRFDGSTGAVIKTIQGTGGKVLEQLLCLNGTVIHSPSSVVVRKELLEKVGGFDTRLSTSADWDLWVRLAAETSFGYLEEPLVKYRVHPGQMHTNIRLMEKDMHHSMQKHFANGLFASEKEYHYCRGKMRLVLSACYLGDDRNFSRALYYFLLSVYDSPRPAINYLLTKLRLQ